ncbi:MAG: hypothetical protein HeimC2_30820 [Candidatus Heimdallarchaeota archaeon LC_2]|nr:MAG: hypothetical protein HeimC2_30820 [Candidatus Heimdallarchaeota archaeon LC_2]
MIFADYNMTSVNDNPSITPFLRTFTLIEAIVLIIVGFGLFIFPELTRPEWPWAIAPFNARFLGAIYLGAMASVAYMFLSPRWSPSRPILRAIFTFTFIVLVISAIRFSEFDTNKTAAIFGWFVLYISLPASAAYHMWLYRSMPTTHLNPVPRNWMYIMISSAFVLGLYGTGLLVLPDTFSSLFPWKLDVFHSQLYSATFITGAVMLITISKFATPAEFIATGLTEAIFGIFSILGLIIVDGEVPETKKIDWVASNTIGWLLMLSGFVLLGISLIRAGLRQIPGNVPN